MVYRENVTKGVVFAERAVQGRSVELAGNFESKIYFKFHSKTKSKINPCLIFDLRTFGHDWCASLIVERDVASGDGNAVREEIAEGNAARPSVMKWLKPR